MDYNLLKAELFIEESHDNHAIKIMNSNKEMFELIKELQMLGSPQVYSLFIVLVCGCGLLSLFFFQIELMPMAFICFVMSLLMLMLFYVFYQIMNRTFDSWLSLCKDSEIVVFNSILIHHGYKIIKEYNHQHQKLYRVILLEDDYFDDVLID